MVSITMTMAHATHVIVHGLSEHPSYNTAASSSKTEAYTVNNPEDNILKNTIPVVRDMVGISSEPYVSTTFIKMNPSFKKL
jgi:hypothetical protein